MLFDYGFSSILSYVLTKMLKNLFFNIKILPFYCIVGHKLDIVEANFLTMFGSINKNNDFINILNVFTGYIFSQWNLFHSELILYLQQSLNW